MRKLLAGLPVSAASPSSVNAFICDGCVARAHAELAAQDEQAGTGPCSFCHQRRPRTATLAVAGTRICDECLGRYYGILSA